MVFSEINSHYRLCIDTNEIVFYIEKYKETFDYVFLVCLSDYIYNCLRNNIGWEERIKSISVVKYNDIHRYADVSVHIWANYFIRNIKSDGTRYKTYVTLDDDDYKKITHKSLQKFKELLFNIKTQNTTISFKMPKTIESFIKDNERLVVHYSLKEAREDIDNAIKEWVDSFKLKQHVRLFLHGFDTKDTSHGIRCAQQSVKFLKNAIHENIYTTEQLVDIVLTTFFKSLKEE